jgi:Spy/CpxP family protein refolding chaperone
MSNRTILRRTRQAALASALFVALAGVAVAGPGPRGGFHGGPQGEPVAQAIAHVKEKLALNAEQQKMFDATVAQSRAAREAGRTEMLRIREAMKAELAKPEPDLASVAAIGDEVRAKVQAERAKVRASWLNLYGTFTTAQKQVVRDYMVARMARHEAWREKMRERFGDKGRSSPSIHSPGRQRCRPLASPQGDGARRDPRLRPRAAATPLPGAAARARLRPRRAAPCRRSPRRT